MRVLVEIKLKFSVNLSPLREFRFDFSCIQEGKIITSATEYFTYPVVISEELLR